MKLAFDTSVLVPALVKDHPFHVRALPWLEGAARDDVDAECTWHALAESWSVLTRLPLDPPLTPQVVELSLARVRRQVKPVEVPGDSYLKAIRRCSERGLSSGAVFDALHLVSAEERGVDALVTFNDRDFHRLASEGSPEILVPPDPPLFNL